MIAGSESTDVAAEIASGAARCQPGRLRNIAIALRSDMPYFQADVARELRRRTGANAHAYCSNKEQLRFYRELNRDGVFDTLTAANPLVQALEEDLPPYEMILAAARANESALGLTYGRLAMGNRHFGRGYALGGSGHPRSRIADAVTHERLLHAYNRLIAHWLGEFRAKEIDLVIGTGTELATLARHSGILFRGFYGSRYRNYHYWGDDECYGSERIRQRFRALERAGADGDVDLAEPYLLAQVNHSLRRDMMNLPQTLRQMVERTARHAYWRLRGYEKGKGYYLGDELRLFARRYRDWRRLTGPGAVRYDALRAKAYVFYALQTEPETQIHQTSPEHFFQLEAIAALSRDLPAGVLLAVKETPYGIGRRPPHFYDQVAALHNTVMVNIDEPGFELVRGAAAVAVIVGTTGHEAAVIGKPVISFGRHNLYNVLDHVYVVEDGARLRDRLAHVLGPDFDAERARRQGRLYLRAIIECSFDMENYTLHDVRNYTPQSVAACVGNLLESLDGQAPAAPSGRGMPVRRAAAI